MYCSLGGERMADITNMTYGRSSAGITKLKQNFEGDINKAMKALESSDQQYSALVKEIKASWSGADADKFLKLLDQQRSALYDKFKSYKHTICDVLDQDLTAFEKAQSTNATTIESSIKIQK
jgi:hypothetical protein